MRLLAYGIQRVVAGLRSGAVGSAEESADPRRLNRPGAVRAFLVQPFSR